jgi:Skp family chaperone for outer membrane proteins
MRIGWTLLATLCLACASGARPMLVSQSLGRGEGLILSGLQLESEAKVVDLALLSFSGLDQVVLRLYQRDDSPDGWLSCGEAKQISELPGTLVAGKPPLSAVSHPLEPVNPDGPALAEYEHAKASALVHIDHGAYRGLHGLEVRLCGRDYRLPERYSAALLEHQTRSAARFDESNELSCARESAIVYPGQGTTTTLDQIGWLDVAGIHERSAMIQVARERLQPTRDSQQRELDARTKELKKDRATLQAATLPAPERDLEARRLEQRRLALRAQFQEYTAALEQETKRWQDVFLQRARLIATEVAAKHGYRCVVDRTAKRIPQEHLSKDLSDEVLKLMNERYPD